MILAYTNVKLIMTQSKWSLKDCILGLPKLLATTFLFSDEELKVINDLKSDQTILMMRPDKCNGAVVIDQIENTKMEDILFDLDKFRIIT